MGNRANTGIPTLDERAAVLTNSRRLKMSRSAHAFVRGNTRQFYEWLESVRTETLPEGPPVWICGDCHLGNLGPVADARERIRIQIRDLDQTVIGNPAHDLVRLGLSLASAARGSNLPGITTANMVEQMVEGYEGAFGDDFDEDNDSQSPPVSVRLVLKQSARRSWIHLARERLDNPKPSIPLGPRFWPLSKDERRGLEELFDSDDMRQLATSLRSREDDARVRQLDAAYWMKGCSSLGRLRYAVLLSVGNKSSNGLCLMDVKEASKPAAPRQPHSNMPLDSAQRVVEGARQLAPALGNRMRAGRLLERSVVVRELMPQDLKLEIERLTCKEAMKVARYLARVVGRAHARQMNAGTRKSWFTDLQANRSKDLDAPSWLWSSIVQLLTSHEGAYLEHCRKYALEATRGIPFGT
ncbi:Uncharacterized conserved protein, DUF2252 family [Rhizobiales bacterium GAS113]|nr:Uncharacterized conserved protein, DUF2252 family [Rhizobiales bacterium GAS113]